MNIAEKILRAKADLDSAYEAGVEKGRGEADQVPVNQAISEILTGTINREITLDEGVTKIIPEMFFNCQNLRMTSLPSTITSIGDLAFYNCYNIGLTELPSKLSSVGVNGFNQAFNLRLTSLPSTLSSIGAWAFHKCSAMDISELPPKLTVINPGAFANTGAAMKLRTLPSGVTKIDQYAFLSNTAIGSEGLTLPASVKQIAASAFEGCSSLRKLTFKGTPTSIASTAFTDCPNLTAIYVPWSKGAVANAPWGAIRATIYYNYSGG